MLGINMANQNKVPSSDILGKITIDFGGICRFCLAETNTDCISVTDKCLYEESKGLKPESVLRFITKLRIIKMNNSENFPSKICKNCHELIELFHNFSQLVKTSDSLLKKYHENTLKETNEELISEDNLISTEVETPLEKSNIATHNLPQAVHFVVDDKSESNSFSKYKESVFEGYRLELNKLAGRIKENQLQLTKDIQLSSQLSGCENTNLILGKELPHSCSECSLKFKSAKALNIHYAAKHTKRRFSITLRFKCEKCIKSFNDLETLRSHYKVSHNVSHSKLTDINLNNKVMQSVCIESIKFFCFRCVPHEEFQTQNLLIKHLEDCHKIKESKGSPVLYSCAHCPNGTFVTRLGLNQHMLWVHKVKDNEINWSDVKYVLVAQRGLSFSKLNASSQPKPNESRADQSLKSPPNDPSYSKEGNPLVAGRVEKQVTQGGAELWCCPECPTSYTRKPALKLHLRDKHNQAYLEGMKCPECPETFRSNRRLIQHGISAHEKYFAWSHHVFNKVLSPVKEESREKTFECDICKRKYIKKGSLKKHIMKTHLGTGSGGAVNCPYCKKKVSNKFNLKSHIEFIHEALFVSCPICKKKINFRTIGRHYKVHKANVDGDFSGNIYRCKLCGKILKSKRSFENHEKIHQNIRDEICDVCGKEFTSKKVMRLHRKSHEGVARKTYTCNECEKVFSGRHSLKRHLLLHSGQKNFICEMCSKGFYTIEELNRHVRYHKRDYRFTCPLCTMKFLYKSGFRHHLMRHRNIRPYKCEFCEKMFIERAKLNMHMTTKHNVEVVKKKAVWKDPKTYVPLDDLL